MMAESLRLTETARFDQVEPDNYTPGPKLSGWLSMRDYRRALVLVQIGTMGSGGEIDAKVQQAKDSAGHGATDIIGKVITNQTEAAGHSHKMLAIEVESSDLDWANGFSFIRGHLIIGTAASDAALLIVRYAARTAPVAATNLDEIVA